MRYILNFCDTGNSSCTFTRYIHDLPIELICFHSSSQRERVMSVFKRQLAVPLLGTEELFINDTSLPFVH